MSKQLTNNPKLRLLTEKYFGQGSYNLRYINNTQIQGDNSKPRNFFWDLKDKEYGKQAIIHLFNCGNKGKSEQLMDNLTVPISRDKTLSKSEKSNQKSRKTVPVRYQLPEDSNNTTENAIFVIDIIVKGGYYDGTSYGDLLKCVRNLEYHIKNLPEDKQKKHFKTYIDVVRKFDQDFNIEKHCENFLKEYEKLRNQNKIEKDQYLEKLLRNLSLWDTKIDITNMRNGGPDFDFLYSVMFESYLLLFDTCNQEALNKFNTYCKEFLNDPCRSRALLGPHQLNEDWRDKLTASQILHWANIQVDQDMFVSMCYESTGIERDLYSQVEIIPQNLVDKKKQKDTLKYISIQSLLQLLKQQNHKSDSMVDLIRCWGMHLKHPGTCYSFDKQYKYPTTEVLMRYLDEHWNGFPYKLYLLLEQFCLENKDPELNIFRQEFKTIKNMTVGIAKTRTLIPFLQIRKKND